MRHTVAASVWQPKAPGLMRVVQLELDAAGVLRDLTTDRNPQVVETPESAHAADLVDAIGKRLRAGHTVADQLVALGHLRDMLAELAVHERLAGQQVRAVERAHRVVRPVPTAVA